MFGRYYDAVMPLGVMGLLISLLLFPVRARSQPGNILFQKYTGSQKMLFIRINYPDDPGTILSDGRAPVHAGILKETLEINSYGRVNVTIDVTPVLTMPHPLSYYQADSSLFVSLLRARADAVALAERAGFPPANYTREIIFTRKFWHSPATGLGTINTRTAFMACDCPYLSAHEIGHTFDWAHANFWKVFGDDPTSPNGQEIQYGDAFDIMGDQIPNRPRAFHHYNPWYKYRAGWLPEESILTVTGSDTFVIQALELPPEENSPGRTYSSLRIRKDLFTDYWVFYRSQEPFANRGVLITTGYYTNMNPTLLLDMHPGSHDEEWVDAALEVGEFFVDPPAGIELKLLEKNPDWVKVAVWIQRPVTNHLPVINVTNPLPQQTVRGKITYQATAFDPDSGNSNGAGIASVEVCLQRFISDFDNDTIATAILTHPPYELSVQTDTIPDDIYPLVVTAISTQGDTNRVRMMHIVDNIGSSIPVGIPENASGMPENFHLEQNFPNPFNPLTAIRFTLPARREVRLQIFDLWGRHIATLLEETLPAGIHTAIFDGKNLGSGVYFYRLEASDPTEQAKSFVQIRKAVLLK